MLLQTGIFAILKRKTMQGNTELPHCERQYCPIEQKRFSQSDGHILDGYITETSLYMYQHFTRRK